MNKTAYNKTMENLRNRIDIKLVSNKKDYLKGTPKLSYLSQKVFHNNFAIICKNKVTLALNLNQHMLECVLMCEFHYNYIENKYGNNFRLLFTGTDSWTDEIRTEDIYKDFNDDKEMFDFSNYLTKSKYYDDSNKLVVGKMKDETTGVVIEELSELKPKMYSFLVGDKSECTKAKGVNKNVGAAINHNEYKNK